MELCGLDLSDAPDPVPMSMAAELLLTSRRTLVRAAEDQGIPRVRVGGGLKLRRWGIAKADVQRLWRLMYSPRVAVEVGPEPRT